MQHQEMIKKLFERRTFTAKERAEMRELYAFGEMFANQMVRVVPDCEHLSRAVMKLKESLADCEAAVALHPKCDKQIEMPAINEAEERIKLNYQAQELEKALAECRAKAAFARR